MTGYDSTLARLAHGQPGRREQACRAVALATSRLEGGRTAPRKEVLRPRLVVAAAPPHQRG